MAMAQTAFRTRPSFYRHSMAEARWSHRAEKPLFQAFLYPSSSKVTDGLCIKDATTIDKTTPRLIQFHTLKNAVNPPFLGGFSIFNTVVA